MSVGKIAACHQTVAHERPTTTQRNAANVEEQLTDLYRYNTSFPESLCASVGFGIGPQLTHPEWSERVIRLDMI